MVREVETRANSNERAREVKGTNGADASNGSVLLLGLVSGTGPGERDVSTDDSEGGGEEGGEEGHPFR